MAKYTIPNQFEIFGTDGEALRNVSSAHVAGVSEQLPMSQKDKSSAYVIDTSQRSFASLEKISQAIAETKKNAGRELYSSLSGTEYNAIHCLALLAPASMIKQNKTNFRDELNKLGAFTEPVTPVSLEEEQTSIDLNRPVKALSLDASVRHSQKDNKDKLYSKLHSVVVGASNKADFEKFASTWGKLDSESCKQLPKIQTYASSVNRQVALIVVKDRLKIINDAILERDVRLEKKIKKDPNYEQTHAAKESITREQIRAATADCISNFFESLPEHKRSKEASYSMTNFNLSELSKNPRVVSTSTLIDPADTKRLEMASRTHNESLTSAYHKEAPENMALLDEALQSPNHPLHKTASVIYTARWGQLMEQLAEVMKKKPITLFPQAKTHEI